MKHSLGMLRRVIACASMILFAGSAWSEQPSSSTNGLVVGVDPRIELIGVVQLLSTNYPVSTNLEFPYRAKVESTFAAYQDHLAVTTFTSMSKSSFSYDAPIGVMLHLSSPPELAVEYPIPDYYISRAGGKAQLEQFLENLRDFAKHSKFMEFFRSNEQYYKEIQSPFEEFLRATPMVPELEQYYGNKQAGYFIYLSPLTQGAFGPKVEVAPNFYNIYSVASPSKFEDGKLHFFSNDGLRYLIWHEFAHSFVNPLTDEHWDSLSTRSDLLTPIIDDLPKWYQDWKAALNEHLVRAVTVRMAYLHLGKEKGDESLANQVEWGYAYVPEIADKLEEYESNRDTYDTFADFYPELVRLILEMDAK